MRIIESPDDIYKATSILKSRCADFASADSLCKDILENPDFLMWPASVSKHHCYVGGLALHTAEVLELAIGAAESWRSIIDIEVITIAAVFHDIGKLRDYDLIDRGSYFVPGSGQPLDKMAPVLGEPADLWFKYAEHRRKIRHVSLSYHTFLAEAQKSKLKSVTPDFIDKVAHCILSHHGRQEWGSPVEPQTPEALALHQADLMSTMQDVNRPRLFTSLGDG